MQPCDDNKSRSDKAFICNKCLVSYSGAARGGQRGGSRGRGSAKRAKQVLSIILLSSPHAGLCWSVYPHDVLHSARGISCMMTAEALLRDARQFSFKQVHWT